MIKKILTSFVLAAALLFSQASVALAAGTTSLSLSGPSGATTVGQPLTVKLYVNGNDLTTVKYKLSYDASKLSCTAASFGGVGVFGNSKAASCGGGAASITRYNDGGTVSGHHFVVSLEFTTIASGTASVSIAAGSLVPKNGVDDWDGVTSSKSFAIVEPAAPAPSAPSIPAPAPVVAAPVHQSAANRTIDNTATGAVEGAEAPTEPAVDPERVEDTQNEVVKDDAVVPVATEKNSKVPSLYWFLFMLIAVSAAFAAGNRMALATAPAQAKRATPKTSKSAKKSKK